MTLKKLIRVGLAGLAALAVAVLLIDPRLRKLLRRRLLPLRPRRRPVINKGDTAWMLTSTVLVLLMTIPGLALFYGGMVRTKNVLSMLTQVFFTVCIVCDHLGGLRLQPRLLRAARRLRRRLRQAVPEGHHGRTRQAATFSDGVVDPEIRLHLLPDDLRRHHAGADRRRLGRAHEVLGDGAVHPACG